MRECILLAACAANELLPQSPDLPADVFTSCLTTPIKVRGHASQLGIYGFVADQSAHRCSVC